MNSHGGDWGLAVGARIYHDRLGCSGYVFGDSSINSDGGCFRSENRNRVSRPKITCSGEDLGLGNVYRLLRERGPVGRGTGTGEMVRVVVVATA